MSEKCRKYVRKVSKEIALFTLYLWQKYVLTRDRLDVGKRDIETASLGLKITRAERHTASFQHGRYWSNLVTYPPININYVHQTRNREEEN
jgi:hypothetical protein